MNVPNLTYIPELKVDSWRTFTENPTSEIDVNASLGESFSNYKKITVSKIIQ